MKSPLLVSVKFDTSKVDKKEEKFNQPFLECAFRFLAQ